jgi:hypothetical protein
MDCSLVLSIWLPPKTAVQQSALGHLSLRDEFEHFTASDLKFVSAYVLRRSEQHTHIMPEVMMAMHDMLDWRSDVAAGNHENGVSAVYVSYVS